jgi:DNA-binding response OmpR family regulator
MKNMKTILVVEDDVSFSESLKKLLEKEGFAVLLAPTAEEAIETIKNPRVSLVLLDLYLPGLNGMEFLDKTASLKRPPIVMLTAFGDWGIYVDAIEKGALDCLAKPVKRQELLRVLQKALGEQMCA